MKTYAEVQTPSWSLPWMMQFDRELSSDRVTSLYQQLVVDAIHLPEPFPVKTVGSGPCNKINHTKHPPSECGVLYGICLKQGSQLPREDMAYESYALIDGLTQTLLDFY
jgi:hypothetical protein